MAKTLYFWIDRTRLTLMVSASAFTVALCFVQIIFRYFTFLTLRPFAWGDEVLRLTAIWVIFLGISIGVRENSHFTVDLFLNKIRSPKARRAVDLLIDVLVVATLAILTYRGFVYAATNTASMLQNLDISMAWFYAAIPVGCALSIMEYAYKMVYGNDYKAKVLPRGADAPATIGAN
jgi:TRAP-type C4-dicarboxylate transport system permease small subunit